MSHIKRYIVEDSWKEYSVTLEVDHSILTQERARDYLSFWSGGYDFAYQEGGDSVRGMIRFFGANAIREMIASYGATFSNQDSGEYWSERIRDEEGFGGEGDTPFGYIGIRIVAADVETVGFDDVELKEKLP